MTARSKKSGARIRTALRSRRALVRFSLVVWAVGFGLGPGIACGDGHETKAANGAKVAAEAAATAVTEKASEKAASAIPRSSRPDDARLYFIDPVDGQTVSSPFTVRFGLGSMGVAPAGVMKEATGHHHLIVDADLPPLNLPIPATDQYRHFGAGQTEVDLELAPGEHTLQLLLGDHLHMPHDPPVVSERITITVK